jgi:hypothetical protein
VHLLLVQTNSASTARPKPAFDAVASFPTAVWLENASLSVALSVRSPIHPTKVNQLDVFDRTVVCVPAVAVPTVFVRSHPTDSSFQIDPIPSFV